MDRNLHLFAVTLTQTNSTVILLNNFYQSTLGEVVVVTGKTLVDSLAAAGGVAAESWPLAKDLGRAALPANIITASQQKNKVDAVFDVLQVIADNGAVYA